MDYKDDKPNPNLTFRERLTGILYSPTASPPPRLDPRESSGEEETKAGYEPDQLLA